MYNKNQRHRDCSGMDLQERTGPNEEEDEIKKEDEETGCALLLVAEEGEVSWQDE
jgi:hypothetical protein